MNKILSFLLLVFIVSCGSQNGPGPNPEPTPTPDAPSYATGFVKMDPNAFGLAKAQPFKNADRVGELPIRFDWRKLGFDVPIRNQGSCGSCFIFSSTASLNSALWIFLGQNVLTSEQEQLDCDNDFAHCNGGDFTGDYLVKYGVASDADYPYQGYEGKCRRSQFKRAAQPIAWYNVGASNRSPTNEEIKAAIMQFGYISVDVAATSSWNSYDGGVKQSCGGKSINHMTHLVGWDDTLGGRGVWIMGNSWRDTWGDHGYALMPYGCDSIARDAAYVEIKLPGQNKTRP